jgi:hypothetical protein
MKLIETIRPTNCPAMIESPTEYLGPAIINADFDDDDDDDDDDADADDDDDDDDVDDGTLVEVFVGTA